jgi:hypothetical protein
VEILNKYSDILLKMWPRRIVAIHVDVLTLRIREAVISSNGPTISRLLHLEVIIELLHLLGILSGSRPPNFHILVQSEGEPSIK